MRKTEANRTNKNAGMPSEVRRQDCHFGSKISQGRWECRIWQPIHEGLFSVSLFYILTCDIRPVRHVVRLVQPRGFLRLFVYPLKLRLLTRIENDVRRILPSIELATG
jgi:dolichol kinase